MGFPPVCSLSRSNHPLHMLSGLTEQLYALSNQPEWPCLYADLQLDTAIYSHPVHFADTYCKSTHQSDGASPSHHRQSWSSLCHPPDSAVYLWLIHGLCLRTKVKQMVKTQRVWSRSSQNFGVMFKTVTVFGSVQRLTTGYHQKLHTLPLEFHSQS